MPKKLKRVLLFIVGIFFILLGFVGLVAPFLQGILFLTIGIVLLSMWSPCMREYMYKHTKRCPKLHAVVERVEKWIVKIIG
ncbi:MAG: hypothetical protein ABH861_00630 [Patescibacteria group bacterium]